MAKKPRYKQNVVRSSNGSQRAAVKSQTTGIMTSIGKMPNSVELAVLEYVRQCWNRSDMDTRRGRLKRIDLAYNHEPTTQADATKQSKLDDKFA